MAQADQKHDLQGLYDRSREQFEAWFEETGLLEADIKPGAEREEELRQCVADIKKHKQRYRQIIAQLPKVENFSPEEIRDRIGKVSDLLDLACELTKMDMYLPRKLDKLRELFKHPLQ